MGFSSPGSEPTAAVVSVSACPASPACRRSLWKRKKCFEASRGSRREFTMNSSQVQQLYRSSLISPRPAAGSESAQPLTSARRCPPSSAAGRARCGTRGAGSAFWEPAPYGPRGHYKAGLCLCCALSELVGVCLFTFLFRAVVRKSSLTSTRIICVSFSDPLWHIIMLANLVFLLCLAINAAS